MRLRVDDLGGSDEHENRHGHHDHGDRLVLALQVGEGALLDGVRDLAHRRVSLRQQPGPCASAQAPSRAIQAHTPGRKRARPIRPLSNGTPGSHQNLCWRRRIDASEPLLYSPTRRCREGIRTIAGAHRARQCDSSSFPWLEVVEHRQTSLTRRLGGRAAGRRPCRWWRCRPRSPGRRRPSYAPTCRSPCGRSSPSRPGS